MSFDESWIPRRYGIVKLDSPALGVAPIEAGPRVRYTPEAELDGRRVRVYAADYGAEYPHSFSDPSFEDGIGGWGGYQSTQARTTAQAHTGAGSLEITATAADYSALITVRTFTGSTLGRRYTAGAWVRASASSNGDVARIIIREAGGAVVYQETAKQFTLTLGWQFVEVTHTFQQDDRTEVQFHIYVPSGATVADVFYVDDVSFVEVERIPEALLYDSGWLTGNYGAVDVPLGIIVDLDATYFVQVEAQFADGRPGLSEMRAFVPGWETTYDAPMLSAAKIDMCNAPTTLPRVRLSWSYAVEPPAVNLVTNGGFETNTTGWGTEEVMARSTAQAKYGLSSLLCTKNDANPGEAWCYYGISLTAVEHTASAWVYVPTDFNGAGLELTLESFVGASPSATVTAPVNMALRDQWQRVEVSLTPDAGDLDGFIAIRSTGAVASVGRTIYVDGVQCEVGATATAYIETDGAIGVRGATSLVKYLVMRQKDAEVWRLLDVLSADESIFFDYEAAAYTAYRYAVLPVLQMGAETQVADIPEIPPEVRLEFDGLWLHRRGAPVENIRFDSWSTSDQVTQPIQIQRVWGRRAPVAIIHEQLYHTWSLAGPPAVYGKREWERLIELLDTQYMTTSPFIARFGRQRTIATVVLENASRTERRRDGSPTLKLTEVSTEDIHG